MATYRFDAGSPTEEEAAAIAAALLSLLRASTEVQPVAAATSRWARAGRLEAHHSLQPPLSSRSYLLHRRGEGR